MRSRAEEEKQEGDLITAGSKGIKPEIREACVIAVLSHINPDKPQQWSVCHVLQLRCVLHR